jgi:LPS export ABC transporter protein LptC
MIRHRLLIAAGLAVVAASGACTKDQSVIPTTVSPLADSADQVLSGIQFLLTSGGVRQGKLEADSGFMFENSTRIELRHVKTDFFTKSGDPTGTLTSREGTYLKSRGSLEARDSVVVLSTDGSRRLTTQQLKYDERTNLITTDSAYVLTQNGQVHQGVGFSTDPDLTRFECKGACRGAVSISRPPS